MRGFRWLVVGLVMLGAVIVSGSVGAQDAGPGQVSPPSNWPVTAAANVQNFDHPVNEHWLGQVAAHEAQDQSAGWLSYANYTLAHDRDLLATPTFAQMAEAERVGTVVYARMVDGGDPADLEPLGLMHEAQVAETLIPNLHRFTAQSPAVSNTEFAGLLEAVNAHEDVLYSEPGFLLDQTAVPNDPSIGPNNWWLNQIRAYDAWDIATDASAIGPIMVFDQGVLGTHEDLADNLWTNPDDGSYGLRLTETLRFHGTPVAGTICGQGNNGIGYAGSAWDCEIMEVRSPLSFSATPGDFATGTAYAIEYGSRISNHSWRVFDFSQIIADTVTNAEPFDHLFVAAAGNENNNIDAEVVNWPARLPNDNVFTIAASTTNEGRISYSSYGPVSVDIAAPTEFTVPCSSGDACYGGFSGTSQATPVVAGAVALAWSQNPSLSAVEIKQLTMDTARPVSSWNGLTVTGAILDMNALLQAVPKFSVEPIEDQYSEPGDTVSLQVVASNSGGVITYAATGLPAGLSIDPASGLISGVPTTEQTTSVTVTVTNTDDGEEKTVSFSWTVEINLAPVVTNPGFQGGPQGPVSLQIDASDPNGQPVTFAAAGLPAGATIDPESGLISGTVTEAGEFTVTVTATDPLGLSDSVTFDWTIVGPIIIDDFETDAGWAIDPEGSDGATTGQWEVGNPEQTSLGVVLQLDETVSGSQALVTQAAAGSGVGDFDVDDGLTTARSVGINVPVDADVLGFWYYLAHLNNSEEADFFSFSVVDDGGSVVEVLSVPGAAVDRAGEWTLYQFDAAPYAGQSVQFQFGAADNNEPSLVEAAVDDIYYVPAVPDPDPEPDPVQESIGGTVTDTTGDPVGGVQVDLFSRAADGSRGEWLGFTATGVDGTYAIDVDAGEYVLTFIAAEGEEFTNGSRWLSVPVTVEENETVTGVDAVLIADVDPGPGVLGGTVTTTGGDPVALVAVDLFAANADGSRGQFLSSTATAADGTYSFTLEPGPYVITLIAAEGEEFTTGSRWLNLPATAVGGETVDNLDGVIVDGSDPDPDPDPDPVGGSVSGAVTTAAGGPVPDVGVDLFARAGDGSRGTWLGFTDTDADGVYQFELDDGAYVLTLTAPEGETFADNGSRWVNIPVTIVDGGDVTGIDFALSATTDASISGTVTYTTGDPGADREVNVFVANADGSRGQFLDAVFTDGGGAYSFAVNAGAYIVTFVGAQGETWEISGTQWLNLPANVPSNDNLTVNATLVPAP